MVAAHLAAVDRAAVLPQLGAVRVPSTKAVGAAQTVGATAYWVGESAPKPPSALGFTALSLASRKVVADIAATEELVRNASVEIAQIIERAGVTAVADAWNTALLDPANAGTTDIKPASLTNGLTPITPAGDYQNQVGQVLAGISGGAATKPVLIVSLQSALRLTALRDLQAIGVKVIVTPAAGGRLIAVDADGIAYVDDGGEIKIGEPDMEMRDDPTGTASASVVLVSMFQRNVKVFRSERWVNWAKRADAVAYLTLA
jgi:hypothetical protein